MKKQLETTFRSERPRLLAFIRRQISSREDAEDILQEIFAGTLSNMDVTEPVANMAGYLYRAARNRIVDWYRKKKHVPLSLQQEAEGASLEELLAASGIDMEREFIRNAAVEALLACIEQLPEEQRDVIVQQAIEGKTFREISEATGVPVSTLLARKRYAIQKLRKKLQALKNLF